MEILILIIGLLVSVMDFVVALIQLIRELKKKQ